jgi:hypothetical protein
VTDIETAIAPGGQPPPPNQHPHAMGSLKVVSSPTPCRPDGPGTFHSCVQAGVWYDLRFAFLVHKAEHAGNDRSLQSALPSSSPSPACRSSRVRRVVTQIATPEITLTVLPLTG